MTSSTTTTSHFTFSRVLLRNRLLRFAGIVRVALFWLGQAGILALIVLAGTVWITDGYLSLQTPIVAPSVWDELPAKVYAILGKALAMETEGSFVFSPRWAFVTNNSIAEESFVGAVWAKHLCDFFVSKRSAKSDYKICRLVGSYHRLQYRLSNAISKSWRKWQGWRSEFQSRHGLHNDSAFFTKILDNTGDVVHYLAKFDRQIWIGRIMADLYSAHPKQWSVIGQSALEKEQLQGCDNNKKSAEQNYPIIGQILGNVDERQRRNLYGLAFVFGCDIAGLLLIGFVDRRAAFYGGIRFVIVGTLTMLTNSFPWAWHFAWLWTWACGT